MKIHFREDLDNICEIILDYHNSISEKRFMEKQVYCREIWDKYLSKEGFSKQLYKYIKK